MNQSKLMMKLEELRARLNGPQKNGGMLERYCFFCEHSEHGPSCGYALKAKDLWEKMDYEEVRKLFLEALEEFRLVEGESFGK